MAPEVLDSDLTGNPDASDFTRDRTDDWAWDADAYEVTYPALLRNPAGR